MNRIMESALELAFCEEVVIVRLDINFNKCKQNYDANIWLSDGRQYSYINNEWKCQ